MIRKILHTFWMVALVLGCLSCVREELATPVGVFLVARGG